MAQGFNMNPFRAGSRKARVYSHFKEHGAEAAIKFGVEQGLKAGTVKSWMGGWGKEVVNTFKPAQQPEGKRRIIYEGQTGVVTQPGEYCSEVVWDSNGITTYLANHKMKDAPKSKPPRN